MNNDSMSAKTVQSLPEKTKFYSGLEKCPAYGGPQPPRSTLARMQVERARTREELRALAEQVWLQRGLALIDPLLIPDDFARRALINEANRLYGRRRDVEVR